MWGVVELIDGGTVVGVGGLVLVGLSQYLNHRERVAGLRHRLWDLQMEACVGVVGALDGWYEAGMDYILANKSRLNRETRNGMRVACREQQKVFADRLATSALVLPRRVIAEINSFIQVFNALSVLPEVEDMYDKNLVYCDDPGAVLAKVRASVVDAARSAVGTDRLSAELSRLVGAPKPGPGATGLEADEWRTVRWRDLPSEGESDTGDV